LALPARVDNVLATPAALLVLAGTAGTGWRFLPHDVLDVVLAQRGTWRVHTLSLPAYLAPPGLAARSDGTLLYTLVDASLITLSGSTGRVLAHQDLKLQAVGWPAAIAAGPANDLYLIGQPSGAMTALAYAFAAAPHAALAPRWQAPLGPTHAGAWIGLVSPDLVGVYLPDQHDAQGQMVVLDRQHGQLRASYPVIAPPLGAAPALQRIFLGGVDSVQAVAATNGQVVARAAGHGPLAAGGPGGLVAFVRANQVILARGSDLAQRASLGSPLGLAPTALAWQGSRLIVGTARGLAWIQPGTCR
jgi:hypothetical protein